MKWISLSYWIILLSLMVFFASCSLTDFTNSVDSTTRSTDVFDGNTQVSANVVYGTDGRLDVFQVTDDQLKKLADSTVALIKTTDLTTIGNLTTIHGSNFGQAMNLCSNEKFHEQDTAAFCSGALVAPDTIITAGHCVRTMTDCEETSIVFGFAVKTAGVLPKTVNTNEVYKCKQIIKTQVVNNGADFAVIKLDRNVTNHTALSFRTSGEIEPSASLVVIGHPVGLPTKITTGGTIRSLANPDYILANLDTYGGNSGSAVFNLQTGSIEGVLVRGDQDFISLGGCTVSKVCAEGACRGEDVTRISAISPYLQTSQNPQPTPSLPTETFSSTERLLIPDNNQLGVTSVLPVSSQPDGRHVFVSVNIKHTKVSDLVVKLVAVDGTAVTLHQRASSKTKNLIKTYEVTSSLGAIKSSGNYKLIIQDLVSRNSGSLQNWSIQFK